MSLSWLFGNRSLRARYLVLAGFAMLLGGVYLVLGMATEGGQFRTFMSQRQFLGTTAMFTLLSTYLLALMIWLEHRTHGVLNQLAAIAPPERIATVTHRLQRLTKPAVLVIAAGVAFGLTQNAGIITLTLNANSVHPLDVAIVIGNCVLWGVVALMVGWRVPVSMALMRLGRHLTLDLYDLDVVKPLAKIATNDVLIVAGAMAFMPLQALDAEFRAGNFQAGTVVGIISAVSLFFLPLWGVRANIAKLKSKRLHELQHHINAVDRNDVIKLETTSAHIERLRILSPWPIDLRVVTRVLAYGVIPPLAWIGAALTENFIDRF